MLDTAESRVGHQAINGQEFRLDLLRDEGAVRWTRRKTQPEFWTSALYAPCDLKVNEFLRSDLSQRGFPTEVKTESL
jgi:hypothetical protein